MQVEDIITLPHHIRVTIPASYIDIFEHMNVQYYLTIFNDSVFAMCHSLGMTDDYFRTHNTGFYAVDQRLNYHAEVKVGETVATYSRIFGRTDKKIHFMQFMVNETTNTLAATMEVLAFHVKRDAKRSTAWLDPVPSALDKRIKAEQALAWDVPLSQAIQL